MLIVECFSGGIWRVDGRNYLIYLIMAANSPYVKVGQIFTRGRRTELRRVHELVHASQTRKQKIVFKQSHLVLVNSAQKDGLNTHLAYMVRREKMERFVV